MATATAGWYVHHPSRYLRIRACAHPAPPASRQGASAFRRDRRRQRSSALKPPMSYRGWRLGCAAEREDQLRRQWAAGAIRSYDSRRCHACSWGGVMGLLGRISGVDGLVPCRGARAGLLLENVGCSDPAPSICCIPPDPAPPRQSGRFHRSSGAAQQPPGGCASPSSMRQREWQRIASGCAR